MSIDERYSQKILEATLEYPSGGDWTFDLGRYPDGTCPQSGTQRIVMKMDNGNTEYMEYYGDEISIMPEEVSGKTLGEAWEVFNAKDRAYLQGGL